MRRVAQYEQLKLLLKAKCLHIRSEEASCARRHRRHHRDHQLRDTDDRRRVSSHVCVYLICSFSLLEYCSPSLLTTQTTTGKTTILTIYLEDRQDIIAALIPFLPYPPVALLQA